MRCNSFKKITLSTLLINKTTTYTHAVQSVRGAIQHNGWQKLEPANIPFEEIEIPETYLGQNRKAFPKP
ncbi:MAG: hypothetical protein DRR19_10080 [Candidatus Parabeggiatoa sp. nov. 1]|nr:MAG: hypothetical protein DRR19_10080 [Gammaproteobacteria bacterium]